jgi:uncharacterized membrane protein
VVNEEPNRSLLWPAVLGRHWCGRRPAWAGGFNLYDGTVQHKLPGLHQVRAEAPNNLPYDLVFIGLAAVMLLAGLLLLRVAGSPSGAPGRTARNQGTG